jgi:SAM-dependent methyltransferase
MDWHGSRALARRRHAARYDDVEACNYHAQPGLGRLTRDEEDAYLADIRRVWNLRPGTSVLDAGAGTGTLCRILSRQPGLTLTALEPSPAMLAVLRSQPELAQVTTVAGFCDGAEDGRQFAAGAFDVVASRQLVNGLFDPLTAFRHWQRWLKPGGAVVVIDGLYGRDGWRGAWEEEIDVLPLSACQTLATVPYLLESVGFRIAAVERMSAVNGLPGARTPRYIVVAIR